MFMTNIPRRKIYETMLDFEDSLMDMQILLFNQKSFDKYKKPFEESFKNLKETYKEIKALLVMFLENRKYPLGEDFAKDLKLLLKDENQINGHLFKNPNLKKDFIELCKNLDENLKKISKIQTLNEGLALFEKLDKFNSTIPKILEIRRDKMR